MSCIVSLLRKRSDTMFHGAASMRASMPILRSALPNSTAACSVSGKPASGLIVIGRNCTLALASSALALSRSNS